MSDRKKGEEILKTCPGCLDPYTTYHSTQSLCDDCKFLVEQINKVPEHLDSEEEAEEVLSMTNDDDIYAKVNEVKERAGE